MRPVLLLKAAHYAKVVVRGAENAFHEIDLGVRAMVGGALIEVGSVLVVFASATLAIFPDDAKAE